MKKVFIIMMMALLSLSVKAQYINNIDETELIGEWSVTSASGSFDLLGGKPKSFIFRDNYSEIKREDGRLLYCRGFFVSNSNTKLHLLCITDQDGYTTNRLLNYKIKLYTGPNSQGGNIMRLASFDETDYIELEQVSTSVNAINREDNNETGIFNMQGMKMDNPDGVYIQNGKKFIAK